MQTDPIGYEDQMNLYAYVHNDPLNYTDPTGEWGIPGAIIGAGVEIAFQMHANGGRITSVSDVLIAAAVGGVTGGAGGRFATQALRRGTLDHGITVSQAVRRTAAVGGLASGVGEVASSAINGREISPISLSSAIIGGGIGSGLGNRVAMNGARRLEMFGRTSNLGQGVEGLTRTSYGAGAEAGSSFGGSMAAEGLNKATSAATEGFLTIEITRGCDGGETPTC